MGVGQWIGEKLLRWLKENATDPVFQGRSMEESRALIRIILLVMRADDHVSAEEEQLVEFLMAHIPRSHVRTETHRSLGDAVEDELRMLRTQSPNDREVLLNAATQAAAQLTDPALRQRAYEMAEMVFQATPTDSATYRAWHTPLADALQLKEEVREDLAAAAAREYHFRLRREIAALKEDRALAVEATAGEGEIG